MSYTTPDHMNHCLLALTRVLIHHTEQCARHLKGLIVCVMFVRGVPPSSAKPPKYVLVEMILLCGHPFCDNFAVREDTHKKSRFEVVAVPIMKLAFVALIAVAMLGFVVADNCPGEKVDTCCVAFVGQLVFIF